MRHRFIRPLVWLTFAGSAFLGACGSGDGSASPTSTAASVSDGEPAGDGRCLVRLHGKGGTGADTTVDSGVTVISPTGNAEGWGGRQWQYYPDGDYAAAEAIVQAAVTSCERIIINGFSNGAAFAAKLYCRGETLDGRLLRVVVDDPVPDHGTQDCSPDPAVEAILYWTGGLESTAQPGWDCSDGDWTCEGGTTIGIEAYADALGTKVLDSPFDDHQWYLDAPEVVAW